MWFGTLKAHHIDEQKKTKSNPKTNNNKNTKCNHTQLFPLFLVIKMAHYSLSQLFIGTFWLFLQQFVSCRSPRQNFSTRFQLEFCFCNPYSPLCRETLYSPVPMLTGCPFGFLCFFIFGLQMGQVMFLSFNPNIGCGCECHCLLSSGFINKETKHCGSPEKLF